MAVSEEHYRYGLCPQIPDSGGQNREHEVVPRSSTAVSSIRERAAHTRRRLSLERRYGCKIRFLGVNTEYLKDQGIRIDGEDVFSIGCYRHENGDTIYEMESDGFRAKAEVATGDPETHEKCLGGRRTVSSKSSRGSGPT